ncbi:N-acetylglucosamine-induced protein 1 [Cytospora mali]|uniref:N-acetylglucosamine-induced protein 1 n=1 Tax=Cytospora mali TaxID=578113 RepID=A0A194V4L3_CYTMA|nr:N-acetylglucosamine-induced protein 1 [Valsa mali var. pyri (nom. inval.)]
MSDTVNQIKESELPFPLTDSDRFVLSQTDDEFKYHNWNELREIIVTNNLAVLKRKPSDLRRYMKWMAETKAAYGSTTNYLMQHRLPKSWGPLPFTPASQIPFADPSDFSVLLNDWPYGLGPNITHIVVWTRTVIPTDPATGDVTDESRKLIHDFVKTFFVDKLGPGGDERVMWFKNWVALQSVRALEHIHVLVRDVDPAVIAGWTKEYNSHRQ